MALPSWQPAAHCQRASCVPLKVLQGRPPMDRVVDLERRLRCGERRRRGATVWVQWPDADRPQRDHGLSRRTPVAVVWCRCRVGCCHGNTRRTPGRNRALSRAGRLEQLHHVARGILAQDLPSARTLNDVVAEGHALGA